MRALPFLAVLSGLLRRFSRGLAAALLLLALSSVAWAYDPPPIAGHVTDTARRLQPAELTQLNGKLSRFRQQSGNQIAVLVVPGLEGETLEDVAYSTFQAWKLGEQGKDNGVLVVVALADRRIRIETGKGVGGALTDLQSNLIIRERMAPRMQQGDLRGAIDAGTDGVIEALGGSPGSTRATPGKKTLPTQAPRARSPSQICLTILLVLLLLWLISRLTRGGGFFFFLPGGFGGGGGGGDDDDDRFGGGGGGESGGGGSSDSW